ncbi:MAG TPA: class I SAM-dependent methyltransferase [Solirubrobacteraceae bacterium]|jgi:ubiquinone/menaquinone biosynthesis C-methylase UbiE|nr:class I SAM-dependent methyltransferase [Solirubrobacteraceae bacterium]
MPTVVAWNTDQYTGPNRSTVHLREFVGRVLAGADPPGVVLEAGCGGGAKMLHLADLFPQAHWTGVDHNEEVLAIGRERLDPDRFELVHGDILELERSFGAKRFDISFSIMTLLNLEDYERAIEQLLAVTRERVFILSLFSPSEVDAFVHIRGRLPGPNEGDDAFYNVYSLPRFEAYCRQLGAREIVAEPFKIDIDIPRPTHGGMGTWTERLADGHRLQFSGPLAMPWWLVAIRP